MNNDDIKTLIIDSLNKQHELCNRHSEDIASMKTELPLIRQSVDKLVVVSEQWMSRTVIIEKDVVAIKASKKACAIILGIALTVAGILAGVFGESIVDVLKTNKQTNEDKQNEESICVYNIKCSREYVY